MNRRIIPLALLLASSVCGCASLGPEIDEMSAESPVSSARLALPRVTPEQSYNDGMADLVRGDAVAARLELDRCVAKSAPDSSYRLDCMVALEKMASPSSSAP